MPVYEISHCVPLSKEQKGALAEFITNLHATTFVIPRLFVNVVFDQPRPVGDIYQGAKPHGQTVPNHIRAIVRVGPSRPKEMYDSVALKIENQWNEVVNDATLGAQSFGNLSADQERRFKKLHGIVFSPMVAALEAGVIVPGPGGEGAWLKENMAYFQKLVDEYDDDYVKEMLKEVSEREDLRKLVE